MGLLGNIVGKLGGGNLVGAVGGTIIKGLANRSAQKKLQQNIDMFQNTVDKYNTQQAADQARTDAIVNEDASSNVNTMAAVNAANNINEQNNQQARAQQIVSGGSDESAALSKAQGAQTVGNMLSAAAVQNQTRQDNAYQQGQQNWMAYQSAANAVQNQIAAQRTKQAQNTVNMGDSFAKGFSKAAKSV